MNVLPAGGVQVGLQPFSVTENRALPFAALTQISDGPSPVHRTIGLTRANFGHRSSIDVKGLEDRIGHRACVRPRVHVELFLRPMTVYVASEYAADPCRARTIREHEQRHVDVYAGYAREAVVGLTRRLNEVVGDCAALRDHRRRGAAPSRPEDRRARSKRSCAKANARWRNARREVDTPEEYARVTNACVARRKNRSAKTSVSPTYFSRRVELPKNRWQSHTIFGGKSHEPTQ